MLLDGFFWGLLGWLLLWLGSFPAIISPQKSRNSVALERLRQWPACFPAPRLPRRGREMPGDTWTPSTNSENSWFLLDCYGNWASTARRILNLGIFRGYVYYVLLAQILPRCLGNTEISRVQKMSTKCPNLPLSWWLVSIGRYWRDYIQHPQVFQPWKSPRFGRNLGELMVYPLW